MKRFSNSRLFAFASIVFLATGIFTPVRAQDPDDMQRGVARISLMNGEVSVRRGDSGEWVAGVINAPLLSDDHISTGPNSRAEVQFDAANILRIGGNAEVRLTQLDATRYQMELARGTVTFRVLRPSGANVEVDTPSVSVRPSKQGMYRITVTDAGESEVTSRFGEVEVFTPRGSQWVNAGQTMMARGTAADAEFQVEAAIPGDDWDRWNDSRDRVLTQSSSYQYVGPGVYGVEDLDNYGSWTDVAPYGHVWRPTVGIGEDWAPYRSGRWIWEDWYGWTWVSSDPWGWAPYHYGRWFNQPGFGWCWYPGGLGVRHYWSPALVSFFGFGGGGGFGFGFGHIGWVPLAPYEVFHPWWGRGFYGRGDFGRSFNITNVNITNVYRNARFNGVSGVNANDFRSGRFNNVSRVSGDQVRQAGLVRGQMPIGPTNANTHFSDRAATHIPQASSNARFFTHQQPTPAQRMPFSQQQGFAGQVNRGGADSQGRAFNNSGSGVRDNVTQGGFRGGQQPPGAARDQQSQGGFRGGQQAQGGIRGQQSQTGFGSQQPGVFRGGQQVQTDIRGQQSQPGSMPRTQHSQGSGSGGWHRFGEPAGQSVAPRNSAPTPEGSGFRGVAPSRAFENTRPPAAQVNEAPMNRGGFQRFGQPGGYARPQSLPNPRYEGNPGGNSAPRYSSPVYSRPNYSQPSPRQSAPSYNAPSYSRPSAPSYSAPRSSAPSYSAPSYSRPSAPAYSAPRSSGGGGSNSGGARSSGNGGHGRR